jgi:hypothetical protein
VSRRASFTYSERLTYGVIKDFLVCTTADTAYLLLKTGC